MEVAKTKTRGTLQQFFVETRTIFLENARVGLSLGGELDVPGFLGLIPPLAVKALFLSRQTIAVAEF